jgi:hypothetical protein
MTMNIKNPISSLLFEQAHMTKVEAVQFIQARGIELDDRRTPKLGSMKHQCMTYTQRAFYSDAWLQASLFCVDLCLCICNNLLILKSKIYDYNQSSPTRGRMLSRE